MTVIPATRFWDSSAGSGAFRVPTASTVAGWTARFDLDLTGFERYIGCEINTVAGTSGLALQDLTTNFSVIGVLSRGEASPWDSTGYGVDLYVRLTS
jgi:hypothetical protein